MGLWSFAKSAGKKLFGGDDAPQVSALQKEISDLGLDASGIDISVEGDRVKVAGEAVSQEMKEKVILAVGNVAGVAGVEDAVEGPEPVFHTVEKGDTLSKIAKEFYGKASAYMKIFEANREVIEDPDKIYPGQKIIIPKD